MKETVGTKRIILLVAFLLFNGLVYAGNTFYINNNKESSRSLLQSIEKDTRNLNKKARDIREDNEELNRLSDKYEKLLRKGFVNDQNRVTVRDSFNLMANVTQLISAQYNVSRAEVMEDSDLLASNHRLLVSNAQVELSAIDDVKIYNFVYLIANKYPGLANIKSFRINKKKDITAQALRGMNSSNPEPIVTGTVNFEWISISPIQGQSGG